MEKNNQPIASNFIDRRDFIKKSGILLFASSAFSANGMERQQKDNILKVGLIGCGGRGTGAAIQALEADPNTVLVAMGDIFQDRLEDAHTRLIKAKGNRIQVPKEKQYIGFDAYKKVIESDVDVVLLTTPPGFRPAHFEAAVAARKHVFCEKPVAVDMPGVHKVLAAAKRAKELNLSVVSGFCFRYDISNRATFGRVLDGAIGDVEAVSTFRNGGELWYFDRKPEWTDMTYQLRNWYYYNWLSGDFVVEQSVHSLDMMSWMMKDEMPLVATGTGGRQSRVDPKYGNIYDHFAVEFQYANGRTGTHFTRQQAGASNRNTVNVIGSKGKANVAIGSRYEISGNTSWRYEGKKNNMYQTQHDELFAGIRSGNVINDGEFMAKSTMLAIWTRMVGYTGQTLTYDQVWNSKEILGPEIDAYDWNLKFPGPGIAIPGKTKFY